MNHNFNSQLRKELEKVTLRFYPQISLKIIFTNNFSIGGLFPHKDKVKAPLTSDVVYKYTCSQCNATYVGETTRHLCTHICEHRGLSNRTGRLLSKNPNSNIFKHYLDTGHDIEPSQFNIIHRCSDNLKIIESLAIHREKPNLNEKVSSTPLHIF